jgi:hypothetical protein
MPIARKVIANERLDADGLPHVGGSWHERPVGAEAMEMRRTPLPRFSQPDRAKIRGEGTSRHPESVVILRVLHGAILWLPAGN